MAEFSRWIRLAAGLLILASPLLPQTEAGTSIRLLEGLGSGTPPVVLLGCAAWLVLPVAAGGLLIASARRREGPGPFLRAVTLGLLLLLAFALSTLGSVALTHPDAGPADAGPSFLVSLLLFGMPLVLAGVALARLMGGDFSRSSGGYVRFALGLLLALYGLDLADNGWEFLAAASAHPSARGLRAAAWIVPAAGLLVAAAEAAARLRPRAAVDSAPASG